LKRADLNLTNDFKETPLAFGNQKTLSLLGMRNGSLFWNEELDNNRLLNEIQLDLKKGTRKTLDGEYGFFKHQSNFIKSFQHIE